MEAGTTLTVGELRKLEKLEGVIEHGLRAFVEVGRALIVIRDERLYTDTHETFEGYCKRRWDIGRSRAYQLIEAAGVVETVSKILDIAPPAVESHARVLSDLPEKQQATAWREAVETAPKDEDGEPIITARHVEQVAKKIGGGDVEKTTESRRPERTIWDDLATWTGKIIREVDGIAATNQVFNGHEHKAVLDAAQLLATAIKRLRRKVTH